MGKFNFKTTQAHKTYDHQTKQQRLMFFTTRETTVYHTNLQNGININIAEKNYPQTPNMAQVLRKRPPKTRTHILYQPN